MRKPRIATRVELLESREMLSVTMILAQHQTRVATPTTTAQVSAAAVGGNATETTIPKNTFIVPPAGGIPTAAEQKREAFFVSMSGKYVVGPGRFSDQSMSIYFKGIGDSTYFLHGDIQVGIVVPTDTTVPASGNATSYDRNVNTNFALSLDLTAVPGAVDKFGRPTQFTFATDLNASAGVFDEAVSSGLLTIHYLTGGPTRHGVATGTATVSIKGSAYTLGTIGNLAVIGTTNTNNPAKIQLTAPQAQG